MITGIVKAIATEKKQYFTNVILPIFLLAVIFF